MATVEELKEELANAQGLLRAMKWVDWRHGANAGMVNYSAQLNRCNQLQLRIQRAEEAES